MTEMLDVANVDAFAQKLHGEVTRPDDADYDEVRALFNAMIDKRPALIASCADRDDVVAAVNFGHEQGLDIAIRGGGHNGPGLGSVDDGLVIDLSGLKTITVDPDARIATIGGGCVLGDVDAATHEHALATPAGIISTTGAGGLMLGGGVGHLTRKAGLSIDNILGAEVVLADGSVVTADENTNDDLYRAIRGGGGNFGVVTQLKLRLHAISTVVAGPMFWELDRSADILRWWREFILDAPEDLNGFFLFGTVPPAPPFPEELQMQKFAGIVWCWTGPEDGAEDALAEARSQPGLLMDGVQPMPLPALQSAFDGLYGPGDQWYWRADFVETIPDEAVEKHAEFGAKLPTWKSTMHIYPIDGAAHRVGPAETAWGYRHANWASVMAGVDPDPENVDAISSWSREYHEALHPFSAGGAYVNMMMEEGQDRVEAAYGENYGWLAETKAKYDPSNLFHVNQNIKPAA
ncbi:MAG TPA: FAD-binding oxidoreductase [Gaiellaceae bacterium]|nr:FAD-binding oxidoreductase [Gaiellaceae bacterium]